MLVRISPQEQEVLVSLCDAELEGLQDAYEETTVDKSLNTLDDLVTATASLRERMEIVWRLREKFR